MFRTFHHNARTPHGQAFRRLRLLVLFSDSEPPVSA
jgi:hypothetical protein